MQCIEAPMEIMTADAMEPYGKVVFKSAVHEGLSVLVSLWAWFGRGGLLCAPVAIHAIIFPRASQPASQQRACRDMEECWR